MSIELRPKTPKEILENRKARRAEYVDTLIEKMEDLGVFRSCLTCDFWEQTNEICGMFKQRPPARIIVLGCSEHSDEIPF